ncbi:MAG: TIGR02594 family protein [Candidatus Pacebacteria bacterium]|nr:TIGR02594 family protein [Candidatus Paceibacterota bacterium]
MRSKFSLVLILACVQLVAVDPVPAYAWDLVSTARSYIGKNPTGRARLWCGAFMDLVLKRSGYKGGGNLAMGYKNYGQRVHGPQVGALAIMGRRGGGHVGVVSGLDSNGNPIIISGNHRRVVDEVVYPRRRIIAYVMP